MTRLWTEDPRLAAVYDVECVGRQDHAFYRRLASTLNATSVVDIGCGTGTLAVDLAQRGHQVVGVDPAKAMIDIARMRLGGDTVEWIHGDATDVANSVADLTLMTGHVAQYFVDDMDWACLLGEVRRMTDQGGRLAFEARNPAIDWAHRWTRGRTTATYPHPSGGTFTSWVEMGDVTGSRESYTSVHAGHTMLPDGTHLVCAEALRFRSLDEIVVNLEAAGFEVEQTWGDWDETPLTHESCEFIVLSRRLSPRSSA